MDYTQSSSPFAPTYGAAQDATQPTNPAPLQSSYGESSGEAGVSPLAPAGGNPVGTMTFAEIEQLWINAGGNPNSAPIMAAIAMAESSGNTQAQNNSGQDNSVGLWQINYHGDLAASRTAQFGTPAALLANPLAQAQAAVAISENGQNLQPWSTYTSGAYQQYMPAAGSNSPGVASSGSAVGTPVPNTVTSATNTGSIIDDIGNPIDSFGSALGRLGKDLTPGAVATDTLRILMGDNDIGTIVLRGLEILAGASCFAWGMILMFKSFMDKSGGTKLIGKGAEIAGGGEIAGIVAGNQISKGFQKGQASKAKRTAPPKPAPKPQPKPKPLLTTGTVAKRGPADRLYDKTETHMAKARAQPKAKPVTVKGGGDPF